MRQENLIFLILITAMAVVVGTTFAIVSTLSAQTSRQGITAKIESSQQPAAAKSAKEKASLPVTTPAVSDSESSSEGTSAILSPAETQEVNRMLGELGHKKSTLSASLKSFQDQQQIASTGTIDGPTLDSIIQQLTLTKARSF